MSHANLVAYGKAIPDYSADTGSDGKAERQRQLDGLDWDGELDQSNPENTDTGTPNTNKRI